MRRHRTKLRDTRLKLADALALAVVLEADLSEARRQPREMQFALSEALYGQVHEDMPWAHMVHDAHHAMVDRANALTSLVVTQSEIDRLRSLLERAYPIVDRVLAEEIRCSLDGTAHEVGC